MPTPTDLRGSGVLVTRPHEQATDLCTLIEGAGGRPLRFAALSITGPADRAALAARLADVPGYDLLIFISRNAVAWGLRALAEQAIRLDGVRPRIAAVGAGTAQALAAHGLSVYIQPTYGAGSEALLSESALRDVDGWRILIFRGVGGREHLRDVLRARGAQVDYAECYQRAPGGDDPDRVARALRSGDVALVTLTSVSGMESLLEAMGAARQRLLTTPAVVVSERQREAALRNGWQAPVVIADDASDVAIVRALIDLRATLYRPAGM